MKHRRLILIMVALVVVGAGTAAISSQFATDTVAGEAQPAVTSPEEQSIRDVIEQFVIAGKNVDRDALTALMCPDDAQYYLDSTEDPGEDAGLQDPITSVNLQWSAVRIQADVAAATFATPWSSGDITVYLRKIDGSWLTCEDAEDELASTAPTTPGD